MKSNTKNVTLHSLLPNGKFQTLPNQKSLQMGTFRNFHFSHSVFKILVLQTHKNMCLFWEMCKKGAQWVLHILDQKHCHVKFINIFSYFFFISLNTFIYCFIKAIFLVLGKVRSRNNWADS